MSGPVLPRLVGFTASIAAGEPAIGTPQVFERPARHIAVPPLTEADCT